MARTAPSRGFQPIVPVSTLVLLSSSGSDLTYAMTDTEIDVSGQATLGRPLARRGLTLPGYHHQLPDPDRESHGQFCQCWRQLYRLFGHHSAELSTDRVSSTPLASASHRPADGNRKGGHPAVSKLVPQDHHALHWRGDVHRRGVWLSGWCCRRGEQCLGHVWTPAGWEHN